MKQIIHYNCTGSFGSKISEGFVYLSNNPNSQQVLFIIKGLYGYFHPEDTLNFTNILLEKIRDTHHIIIGNSSRLFVRYDDTSEAFKGKFMQEEIYDIHKILYEGLNQLENYTQIKYIHIWGSSFGGTLAIQLPYILNDKVQSITVMNSPSGANSQTKPLLKDLAKQTEEITFKYIRQFTGVFNLIQGGEDTIVPHDSGQKIFSNAMNAYQKNHFFIQHMDHRGFHSKENAYAVPSIALILNSFCSKV